MTDSEWKIFFMTCADILGKGSSFLPDSLNYCAWATFDAVGCGISYWTGGLPNIEDLEETYVNHGSWGQPFLYKSLAHIVISKEFGYETGKGNTYEYHTRTQDIENLSIALNKCSIIHKKTALMLEIKLY